MLQTKFSDHQSIISVEDGVQPVLGVVDGSLHLTVPFMNRLNQTEPATFSILPRWVSLGLPISLYFKGFLFLGLETPKRSKSN
jgi:hypothetical protein